MTTEQAELCAAIDCQKMIVRDVASNWDNEADNIWAQQEILENLFRALRNTFRVVSRQENPQYAYSKSKAVLKLLKHA